MISSRKNLKFYKGVLENAGLGEISFYLKKANQNILYAAMALENTDFSSFDELTAIQAKIVRLNSFIAELGEDLSRAGNQLAVDALEKGDSPADEGE